MHISYPIFQNNPQGHILEGFDPQTPGFVVKPTFNEGKLSISAKTDRRSSKSDQNLGSVDKNISTQNLGFSWKIPSR